MTPPETALVAFLRLYAAHDFWESHEVLEGPWRESGDAFTQALILYASAWVHWQRRNAHGVQAQLGKTLDRLTGLPAEYAGFDIDAIRAHCRSASDTVRRHPLEWPDRVTPLDLSPPVGPDIEVE